MKERPKGLKGKKAELEIARTFQIYRNQEIARAVKVETQYRPAYIGGRLGAVKITQTLPDFVGCTTSGRLLMVEVKEDDKASLSIGAKATGVKRDQVDLLVSWAKWGAIARVLWKNKGTWFQIPAHVLLAADIRRRPIRRTELEAVGLNVPIGKNGLVDFLALTAEAANEASRAFSKL